MNYIVDFEGFNLSFNFVIKEFVLLSLDSEKKVHFLLNSPRFKNKCFKLKETKSIAYCENYLHCVRWRTRGQTFADLLNFLHKTLKSEDTVFIKGLEKVKVFCKQLNPPCRVRDINELLTFAEVSKDWITLAREQINKNGNSCPLYFHKSNPHCANIKTEIFSRILKTANVSKYLSQ